MSANEPVLMQALELAFRAGFKASAEGLFSTEDQAWAMASRSFQPFADEMVLFRVTVPDKGAMVER